MIKSQASILTIPVGRLMQRDIISVGGKDYSVRSIQHIDCSPNLRITLILNNVDSSTISLAAHTIEMEMEPTTTLEIRTQ